MTTYDMPVPLAELSAPAKTVYLVASGDLRESANTAGWPTQVELEKILTDAFAEHGWRVERAHEVDPETCHGFISSQRMGMNIFATIPPDVPLVVAEAVWQYSHHVLAGLRDHRPPLP